ncbi:hypothetical protein ACFQXB_05540 [Plastorhodobacter daqingensis]|uniref:Secreted protein n=1 Tax=Plastorhodobacter daqingensis TaxID=1387281 RepID=A0ABW2UGA8_9RHOB
MKIPYHRASAGIALGAALIAAPVLAQETAMACESQQSLQQVLESNGSIQPDDCRPIGIAQLEASGRSLCLIDLSQQDGGLIDDLRGVAAAQEWWLDCSELTRLADPAP